MSSAASRPHNSPEPSSSQNSSERQSAELRQPPVRPTLMSPPSRAVPPRDQPAEASQSAAATGDSLPAQPVQPDEVKPRQSPISPPSEPMQYRAIGLLRGRYIPSEDQFNRGDILTQDDSTIDAVLLGRVTNLIKKHIDLESDHLWVVYPRTFQREEDTLALHVQIVGVWEPETLGTDESNGQSEEAETADKADNAPASDSPAPDSFASEDEQANYFSIRGEITKYVEDKGEIVVNIVQKAKKDNKLKRPFRLTVNGHLEGKTIGHFWDLNVERQGRALVLREGKPIAVVPPKKKPKRQGGGRQRFGRSARKLEQPESVRAPRSETPKPELKPQVKSEQTKAHQSE